MPPMQRLRRWPNANRSRHPQERRRLAPRPLPQDRPRSLTWHLSSRRWTSQAPVDSPPSLSAHYGEQNGDLMRDPEMCFELGPRGRGTPNALLLAQRLRRRRAVEPVHPRFRLLLSPRASSCSTSTSPRCGTATSVPQGFAQAFDPQTAQPRLTRFPPPEREHSPKCAALRPQRFAYP